MRSVVLMLCLLGLSACAVGPDYVEPELDLPDQWPEHVLLDEDQRVGWQLWWEQFEDPQLDTLVRQAIANNLDVRIAAARIQEARAALGLARAEQMPTVEGQAEAARRQQPATELPSEFGGGSARNLFSVAGVLSYELDLWGRLARETEAAEAALLETVFTRDASRLNVITDVVATYFDLRAAQAQLAIAERTVESREETFALEQRRFQGGVTDELTARQAESELETARADLPALRERVERLESALAVLIGQSPREILAAGAPAEAGELDAMRLPDEVPVFLPSELLQRRPDIRAAEAGLIAANARIGVAEAARLPSLNLSALLGTQATRTGDLFTGAAETWSVGASLVGPLLDFGRSSARIESAEAVRDQAELRYRQTVQIAFQEVRDALALYSTAGERLSALERQVEVLERTLALAERRYEGGMTAFIDVLDAQRALLAAELSYTEALRDRYTAAATLFKALGGGWSDDQ